MRGLTHRYASPGPFGRSTRGNLFHDPESGATAWVNVPDDPDAATAEVDPGGLSALWLTDHENDPETLERILRAQHRDEVEGSLTVSMPVRGGLNAPDEELTDQQKLVASYAADEEFAVQIDPIEVGNEEDEEEGEAEDEIPEPRTAGKLEFQPLGGVEAAETPTLAANVTTTDVERSYNFVTVGEVDESTGAALDGLTERDSIVGGIGRAVRTVAPGQAFGAQLVDAFEERTGTDPGAEDVVVDLASSGRARALRGFVARADPEAVWIGADLETRDESTKKGTPPSAYCVESTTVDPNIDVGDRLVLGDHGGLYSTGWMRSRSPNPTAHAVSATGVDDIEVAGDLDIDPDAAHRAASESVAAAGRQSLVEDVAERRGLAEGSDLAAERDVIASLERGATLVHDEQSDATVLFNVPDDPETFLGERGLEREDLDAVWLLDHESSADAVEWVCRGDREDDLPVVATVPDSVAESIDDPVVARLSALDGDDEAAVDVTVGARERSALSTREVGDLTLAPLGRFPGPEGTANVVGLYAPDREFAMILAGDGDCEAVRERLGIDEGAAYDPVEEWTAALADAHEAERGVRPDGDDLVFRLPATPNPGIVERFDPETIVEPDRHPTHASSRAESRRARERRKAARAVAERVAPAAFATRTSGVEERDGLELDEVADRIERSLAATEQEVNGTETA